MKYILIPNKSTHIQMLNYKNEFKGVEIGNN